MSWIEETLLTSVGKKLLMAVTGLGFIGFLTVHLLGNLTIYAGPDAFNAYAEHLHSLGILVNVAELGLLLMALVHVITGAYLYYQNLMARPVRYAVDKRAGGRTVGSGTMPYTGLFILVFLVVHLSNFHFVDKSHTTIFAIVSAAFSNPSTLCFYVLAMGVVALHVSHGLWSAFQTLGANHSKYMPVIMAGGTCLAVIFAVGFGFIPVYMALAV